MSKISTYQEILHHLEDWDAYLLSESGLPGPRGNIELAQAVAQEGNLEIFQRYLTYSADIAPVNSPYEFLAFCGTLGLGRLLSLGDRTQLQNLRSLASDRRWRVREAVAMALQMLGDVNMEQLILALRSWKDATPFEQRAVAAALCEPRLLGEARYAHQVLIILDEITTDLELITDRRSEGFIALRKGLGYCWSVAVASLPTEGKALMEKWLASPDKDVHWIMMENLKKNRLARMDPTWMEKWRR